MDESERSSFKTSVKNLLRLYLEAAQYLLDTVVPSSHLLKLDEKSKVLKEIENMGKLHFAPSLLESDEQNFTSDIRQVKIGANVSGNVFGEIKPDEVESDTITEPLSENPSVTEVPVEVNNKTDSEVHNATEDGIEDRIFSDMIQGDQEFGEKDDYHYESDYPAYSDYDDVEESDHSELTPALSEAEATERLKRLLLSPLNFFNIFNNNEQDHSSSHTNSKRKRSVDGINEQISSGGERTISGYKPVEEKEELRLHGSRDLVIEVPDNSSGKLGFHSPSKQDIKVITAKTV